MLSALPTAAHAGQANQGSPALLSVAVGQGNVFDDGGRSAGFGIELNLRPYTRWLLTPMFGMATAENDSSFVYLGLRRAFWLNARWALIPSFGAGVYQDGGELDLGNPLEFRSGLELARRLDNDIRIGIALYHVSNGGLSERNPGTETIVLSLSIPMQLE